MDEERKQDKTRKYWFTPRNLKDLPEVTNLTSNDTTLGCGYAPIDRGGRIVLDLEHYLNSESFKKERPWLGSDIKIMAFRTGNDLNMTICIPQIADYVPNVESYKKNLETIRRDIEQFIKKTNHNITLTININTRDNFETCELYLTAIGSSIESGDEGVAGRGNRANGLITPCMPMSIEGVCGKNPIYHSGKIYNILANRIAEKLHKLTNSKVEVFLISQSGRPLQNPWKTIICLERKNINDEMILSSVLEELKKISEITNSLLRGEINPY